MTEELKLTDENIDQVAKEAKEQIKTKEDIKKDIEKKDRAIVNDKSSDDEINLGELGTFKKADPKDIEEVFEKLPGTIFQLKSCLFRVSYINDGDKRFTAKLLNV